MKEEGRRKKEEGRRNFFMGIEISHFCSWKLQKQTQSPN
jgi:hypothetical protein